MKPLATIALLVLSLAACNKDAAPTTPVNTGGDDPAAVEPAGCTAAEDCVAVELACCDACNGGEAVAVHKDQAEAMAADSPRGRGECAGTACTEMACPAWVPACEAGTCMITRGSF